MSQKTAAINHLIHGRLISQNQNFAKIQAKQLSLKYQNPRIFRDFHVYFNKQAGNGPSRRHI